ncbi:MAG: integrase arm-type DNA-binding domain-containing protein [Hyphomicrobiaceae bacterium]
MQLSDNLMGRGAHFRNRLTASQIRAIKPTEKEQRVGDGAGLYLCVDSISKGGSKRWAFRCTIADHSTGRGKLKTFGFGHISDVTLAQARERASLYRSLAHEGTDPRSVAIGRDDDGKLAVLDWSRRSSPAFAEAFDEFAKFREGRLTSDKFAKQWRRDVERFCLPAFGAKQVPDIDVADVMAALAPAWHNTPDTARKVGQRLGAFFDYALGQSWHRGPNPVPIARASLGKQSDRVKHRPALPWQDVPTLYSSIDDWEIEVTTRLALRAVILTGSRSKEVREATHGEIDRKRKIWTRPAEHMKTRVEHRIPLTPGVAGLIEEAQIRFPESDLIFPGRSGRVTSDGTLQMALKRHHGPGVTVAGFRSSFRDWVSENDRDSEAAEQQLAHVAGKVVRAYARSDLLTRRITLMREWENYVLGGE